MVGTTSTLVRFAEHIFATGGAKLFHLCANALIVRWYPASRKSYRLYATKKPFDFKAVPCLAPVIYICNTGYMDNVEAIAALAALAQPTRLDTFRLLVEKEPKGVPAGELARLMAVPQNTMSAHLAILARAGLVIGERQSRSIIYRADLVRVREVALFLLKDCCGGRPDICAPLVADLTPCRSRKVRVHD